MNKTDFNKLTESIRQAGKIRRGTMKASRMGIVEPEDIRSIRQKLKKTQSDVDILIDLDEGTEEIFEVKRLIQQELEKKFNRKVEIASERYIKPYYREEILGEAVYV